MGYRVIMQYKETAERVTDPKVEARSHGTNYQAMVSWRGIVKIAYGDSMEAAVQNAFDEFRNLGVLSGYDIRLMPGG